MHASSSGLSAQQSAASDYDAVPVGLCVLSRDLRFLRVNETMAMFNGYAPEEHIGRTVSEIVPDLEDVARGLMKKITDTGETIGPFEVAGKTPAEPEEQRFWMEFWSPVTDALGHIVGASVAAVEITERKRLEREKDQALRVTERRLQQQTAIAEIGQLALQDTALQIVLNRIVEAAATALDVPLTKVLAFEDTADQLKLVAGVGWAEGLVGVASVGIERESQAGYTLLSGELIVVDALALEERFSGPPLLKEHGVVSGMSVTIAGPEGRPYGVIAIHATERRTFDRGDRDFLLSLAAIISNAVRKEAAKTQSNLLIREMSHRAGNMLQLVSSIAAQTFRHSKDPEEAREAFNQRLASLARANHAIAQQGWSDTRFQKVAEDTLSPVAARIRMEGRDIQLPAELCFDLGLVLNELCTNSVKYGSLGGDDGIVSLAWNISGQPKSRTFHIRWDDPVTKVARAPSSSSNGLGTKLIQQLVVSKWHGTIDVQVHERYLMKIDIPLSSISDGTTH